MTIIRKTRLKPTQRSEILNAVSAFLTTLHEGAVKSSALKAAFKKLEPDKPDPATRTEALKTFFIAEERCRATNMRIRTAQRINSAFADQAIISIAARKISSILGTFSIEEMLDLGRFGPGSTYQCRGEDVSRTRKFSLRDVTVEFNKLARGLLADYPLWAQALTDADCVCPLLEPVPGGRLTTVPKDTKTDRTICIEPTINSWFQQGIGRMIRKRLRRVGVDLDDQTINQRLAKLGSITDDLATIDLSSASDLISTKLVEELLLHSPDWYFWLDKTRSRRIEVEGNWVEIEKFSSMGNGFIFDLESLIFYALAFAVTATNGFNPFWVNTFGDDIVVPSGVAENLFKVFSDCGFSVNLEKSYWKGPFRESCGKDYNLGQDVRGFYVKQLRTDLDVLKLHNKIYAWSQRTGTEWEDLRAFLLNQAPRLARFRVPQHLGDGGFHSSFDECNPPLAFDQWESFKIRTILPILMEREKSDRFLLLERLQGSDFDRNTIPLRRDPIGYRETVTISQWYP